jgi:glycosyltransferase involved in cell wall biosynthesis
MFEYLASGTPIISSNLKVLREILKNKYNSILIKNFENLDEWTKAILSLSRNKKLMKKISMNGRKTAIKYSWDLRAKEYLNQFKKNN